MLLQLLLKNLYFTILILSILKGINSTCKEDPIKIKNAIPQQVQFNEKGCAILEFKPEQSEFLISLKKSTNLGAKFCTYQNLDTAKSDDENCSTGDEVFHLGSDFYKEVKTANRYEENKAYLVIKNNNKAFDDIITILLIDSNPKITLTKDTEFCINLRRFYKNFKFTFNLDSTENSIHALQFRKTHNIDIEHSVKLIEEKYSKTLYYNGDVYTNAFNYYTIDNNSKGKIYLLSYEVLEPDNLEINAEFCLTPLGNKFKLLENSISLKQKERINTEAKLYFYSDMNTLTNNLFGMLLKFDFKSNAKLGDIKCAYADSNEQLALENALNDTERATTCQVVVDELNKNILHIFNKKTSVKNIGEKEQIITNPSNAEYLAIELNIENVNNKLTYFYITNSNPETLSFTSYNTLESNTIKYFYLNVENIKSEPNNKLILYCSQENTLRVLYGNTNNYIKFDKSRQIYIINLDETFKRKYGGYTQFILAIVSLELPEKLIFETFLDTSRNTRFILNQNEFRPSKGKLSIPMNNCSQTYYYIGSHEASEYDIGALYSNIYGEYSVTLTNEYNETIDATIYKNKNATGIEYIKELSNKVDIVTFKCTKPSLLNFEIINMNIASANSISEGEYLIFYLLKDQEKAIEITNSEAISNSGIPLEITILAKNGGIVKFENGDHEEDIEDQLRYEVDDDKFLNFLCKSETFCVFRVKLGLTKNIMYNLYDETSRPSNFTSYLIEVLVNEDKDEYSTLVVDQTKEKKLDHVEGCFYLEYTSYPYVSILKSNEFIGENLNCFRVKKGSKFTYNILNPKKQQNFNENGKDKLYVILMLKDSSKKFNDIYLLDPNGNKIEKKQESNKWIILIIILVVICILIAIISGSIYLYKKNQEHKLNMDERAPLTEAEENNDPF